MATGLRKGKRTGRGDSRRTTVRAGASTGDWSIADAKARLSELVEKSLDGAQTITRNGKPVAVVVGVDEWRKRTEKKGTLLEFLGSSPLQDIELDVQRWREEPRDLDL
jgi:prevent-host-death family protein